LIEFNALFNLSNNNKKLLTIYLPKKMGGEDKVKQKKDGLVMMTELRKVKIYLSKLQFQKL
jgi:hypothetical protein